MLPLVALTFSIILVLKLKVAKPQALLHCFSHSVLLVVMPAAYATLYLATMFFSVPLQDRVLKKYQSHGAIFSCLPLVVASVVTLSV